MWFGVAVATRHQTRCKRAFSCTCAFFANIYVFLIVVGAWWLAASRGCKQQQGAAGSWCGLRWLWQQGIKPAVRGLSLARAPFLPTFTRFWLWWALGGWLRIPWPYAELVAKQQINNCSPFSWAESGPILGGCLGMALARALSYVNICGLLFW